MRGRRGEFQLDTLTHLGRKLRTDTLFSRPRIGAWCRDGVTEQHTLQPRYLLRAPIDSGICNIDYQPLLARSAAWVETPVSVSPRNVVLWLPAGPSLRTKRCFSSHSLSVSTICFIRLAVRTVFSVNLWC